MRLVLSAAPPITGLDVRILPPQPWPGSAAEVAERLARDPGDRVIRVEDATTESGWPVVLVRCNRLDDHGEVAVARLHAAFELIDEALIVTALSRDVAAFDAGLAALRDWLLGADVAWDLSQAVVALAELWQDPA